MTAGMTTGAAPGTPPGPGPLWGAQPVLVWTAAAGMVLLALGCVTGRADVVLVAVPAVLGAARAFGTRPRGGLDVSTRPAAEPPGQNGGQEPGGSVLAAVVRVAPPAEVPAGVPVTARLRISRPGHQPAEVLVDATRPRELPVDARSVRTGRQPLYRVEHQGVGQGVAGPVGRVAPAQVLVVPRARRLADDLPMPVTLRGLTGQHAARRPGSGGDLRDVHPFSPGDSPRQVDWKVTARRSPQLDELWIRRTTSLGEAVVAVVVDSRDDVGPDPTTWSGVRAVRADDATSLDLAREAAATLAEAYLGGGDRVGIEDLGVRRHAVRTGTGRRQLDRVLHLLAGLQPEGEPPERVRPPRLAAGAFVYVVSTFLDPEAAVIASTWRRAGHGVVAVDVLPRLATAGLDARHALALRLVLLQRDDLLADLAGAGVEVVRWTDEAGSAAHLRLIARQSRRRPGTPAGALR